MPSTMEAIAELERLVSRRLVTASAKAQGTEYVFADTFVAGFRFHDGLDILPSLEPGDSLDLIAEPGNPHDDWAVRVEHRKSRIGYVPRAINQAVSLLLQTAGQVHAHIVSVNPEAAPWECVRIHLVADVP